MIDNDDDRIATTNSRSRKDRIPRDRRHSELMALLSPASGNTVATVGEVHVATIASVRTSTKAPPGTVRPAIFKMIEESSGVSTDQILTATCFKENSVRGTLSTLHKEGKIARNAQGYWIRILEAPAEQLAEAS
jgi:hypothetical protein